MPMSNWVSRRVLKEGERERERERERNKVQRERGGDKHRTDITTSRSFQLEALLQFPAGAS